MRLSLRLLWAALFTLAIIKLPATTAAAAAATPAECELNIVGSTAGNPIKSATAKCRNGPIYADMDPLLAGKLPGFKQTSCGVPGCLLTICNNTQVVLTDTVLVGIPKSALCVAGSANVTITGNSTISNNTSPDLRGAGVFAVGNSTLTITGDTRITGNRAIKASGGGVVCLGKSLVTITGNSSISNNVCRAPTGCGVLVSESCRIDTTGSTNFSKCGSDVTLSRSSCEVGEIPKGKICTCCADNTYSFTVNASTCYPCPANAKCPGGAVIRPEAGYWHSSECSPQIHRCGSPDACGEGGVCRQGYTGTLCGSCEPGYGMAGPMKCAACVKPAIQFGVYATLSMLMVGFITFTVYCTWQDNLQGSSQLRSTDVIKVLVHHLQYLVIVGSMMVPWPKLLQGMFKAAAAVVAAASGQAVPVDCWLKAYGGTLVPFAIQRVLVCFIAPFVVFLCVVVTSTLFEAAQRWYLQYVPHRSRLNKKPSLPLLSSVAQKLPVTALVVAYYSYPTIVPASFAFFACMPMDDASKQPYSHCAVLNNAAGYWMHDLNQACFKGWHLKWTLSLGVLGTVLFCIGAPLALWCVLRANRQRADEPEFRAHFGFLYRNYSKSKLWWESVWMVKMTLLIAVAVFQMSLGAYLATLLLHIIFLISGAIQVMFKPYSIRRLHNIHLVSTACLAGTTVGVLWLFTVDKASQSIARTQVASALLVFIGNVLFVAWCMFHIVTAMDSSVTRLFLKFAQLVLGKLPASMTKCCGRAMAPATAPTVPHGPHPESVA